MDELDQLEGVFPDSEDGLDLAIKLTRSKDPEVRFRAVEKIGSYPCHKIPKNLIRELLAKDVDELVKLSCLEIIDDCEDKDGIPVIRERIFDESWMVRGRAVIVLCKLGAEDANEVVNRGLSSAMDEEERVRYLLAKFILSKSNLEEIKSSFVAMGYRAKCATINLLTEVILEDRLESRLVEDILSFMELRLHIEPELAVKSSIRNSLECIAARQ